MSIRIVCSGCKATLNLADELAGKAVRCKRCQTVCRAPGVVPNKPAVAAAPARRKERPEEGEVRAAANKKAPAPRSRTGLLIGLGAGGCLLLVLAVGGVGAWLVYSFVKKDTRALGGPVAPGPPERPA